jgi:hypothetical protein
MWIWEGNNGILFAEVSEIQTTNKRNSKRKQKPGE